ncbi:high mobility group nucleosome-binding domain-containing protein 4 isoform X3 [Canis lupus baileyi]|uniref:high mobility group nucleosome-binding domain-containing protein 4 isoform X3 n=1 Tax=Canis lupus baileyi TaxID=143281 RepID=UPI0018F75EE8
MCASYRLVRCERSTCKHRRTRERSSAAGIGEGGSGAEQSERGACSAGTTTFERGSLAAGFRSVVVITFASHAKGPRFETGRKQVSGESACGLLISFRKTCGDHGPPAWDGLQGI